MIAGHQQTTQLWWSTRRAAFECFISQVVVDEISAGDPSEVQKRLAIAGTLDALSVTTEAEKLTESIMRAGYYQLRQFVMLRTLLWRLSTMYNI